MEAYREIPRRGENSLYAFDIHTQSYEGKGVMAAPHYHNYIEILYGLSGSFEAMLGNVNISFTVGDMVLIYSQEVHRMASCSDGVNEYVVIKFDPALLFSSEQTAFELKYLLDFDVGASKQRRISREELAATVAPNLIRELLEEARHRQYGFELAIRAGLCRLFLLILRSRKASGAGADDDISIADLQKLQAVFDYVEDNYAGTVSMAEAACLLDMSYSSFSRFFSHHTKKSFSDYVCDVRITKAKILLAITGRSITEVALESGFSTSSYFIACFRKRNKVSPRRFRRQFEPGG